MKLHELLLECLDELNSEEMDLFKWNLNQGINGFKISTSHLENKQRFEVVTCMMGHYSDDAGKLTLLVLEKMKKMDRVKDLKEKLGHTLQSKHTETGTAQTQKGCKPGAEFVEKHRTELIKRVSLVEPIADDMKRVIGNEKYQIILKSGTTHRQMRTLLDFLTTAALKEKLYQSLLEHESHLVADLEASG